MNQVATIEQPKEAKPSIARLHELFSYDAETGVITRRIRMGCCAAGSVVSSKEAKGYIRVNVDGRRYKAHKIAWALHTGIWPSLQIDHENLNAGDNRFRNIRLATNQQNCINRAIQKNNTSGFKGVSFRRTTGRWSAGIRIDYQRIHLGDFATREEAATAYAIAAKSAFGEFSRTT